jgi:SNF2 family DNA or RNA helicase
MGVVSCDEKPSPSAQTSVPDDKSWTSEEIARDPQGYLAWSDRKIQQQITERAMRLDSLGKRRAEVVQKQEALLQDIQNARTVNERLAQAYRRAEDEDRWPVRFAGRLFERDRAKAIIEQTASMVKEREPLRQAYEEAVAKMAQTDSALRADIDRLHRMREKLALDLERVRLNQGMAEVEALRKTESELEAMGKALSGMSEESATMNLRDPGARVTLDSLLKQ